MKYLNFTPSIIKGVGKRYINYHKAKKIIIIKSVNFNVAVFTFCSFFITNSNN